MADRPYVRPTNRQREVIVAVLETGTIDFAARRCRITSGAVRLHLHRARIRGGFVSNEQMVYAGARDGWLAVREMRHQSASAGASGVAAAAMTR